MLHKAIKKWRLNLRPRNIIVNEFSLEQLVKHTSHKAKIDYCLKSLKLIACGAYRIVFQWGDKVVKLGKSVGGGKNNFYEAESTKKCPELFPTLSFVHKLANGNYDIIVQENTPPLDDDEFYEKTHAKFEEVHSLMVWEHIKDIKDQKIKQLWRDNVLLQLEFSVPKMKQIHDKFMLSDNVVSRFINNILKYSSQFKEEERSYALFDFEQKNLGWSSNKNSLVVIDNGSSINENIIWNDKYRSQGIKKKIRAISMIDSGRIDSKTILSKRASK